MNTVLVAPLDWGLGHATRCIPIIRALQRLECRILLAGSGGSFELLKKEFPGLPAYVLPAYDPRYPGNVGMVRAMAAQLPHFFSVVQREHKALEELVRTHRVGFVISDNRYGCWSSRAVSVFITHQSNILMPRRFGWLSSLVRILTRRSMSRFRHWWICDYPDLRLTGELNKTGTLPKNVRRHCIGPLSRFVQLRASQKKFDVVAVLSGPEPQRTILQNILQPQLERSGLKYYLVFGRPESTNPPGALTADFLDSQALQELIDSAELVICRSGYSSVMDLARIGAKAIFIPTPGQTEQEYLAASLHEKGIALSIRQEVFNLREAMEKSKQFSGFPPDAGRGDLLEDALTELLGVGKTLSGHG